jgi:hypothetical protein
MRATLIGHACWVIETTAGCFVTDPVFFDPFEESTVTSCPRREVRLDRLPALRGIVVSHRHLDHFDFPSLAALDRRLPVFCPHEPLLVYGLRRLGFTDLRFLEPFVPQQIDSLRLLPTPSLNQQVREYGLVFQDTSGTLFNQVDTFLAPDAIRRLHHEVGHIDVHLAMYASQHFGFFESQRANTAAIYALNLNTALMLNAGCVVPASAGFRFVDALMWLNSHVFPISRATFLTDLQRLNPALQTLAIDPGDVLCLDHSAITMQPHAAAYVTMREDDTYLLSYDASAPVPPLVDDNPAGYGQQGLQEFICGLLERSLWPYLVREITSGDLVVQQYLQHGVTYQVEVIFPETARCWTYCFDRQHQAVQCIPGPGKTVPHIRKRITASAMVDFCLGRRSYFAIRTQSRQSSQVFDLIETSRGMEARAIHLPDLLTHYIVHAMPGADRRGAQWVDFATRAFVGC